MASQLDLNRELRELLPSKHVYYQPPETLKLQYPCIVYQRDDIVTRKADNRNYILYNRYQLIVMDREEDNPVIYDILNHFAMCEYDRHYIADGLHHDVLTLYY